MKQFDAVVVGAGFAGMYMLHKLRELGFSATVIEAADGVGGTWFWNRYPGARCDVKSIDYSFSFDEDLQQEWQWSEKYATQPEILRYANHVADRFDLRRDIQFETRVESAMYDENRQRWTIATDRGDNLDAQFYIMASGCLSVPKTIDIDGCGQFKGATYHTADWPRDGVDFTGKRVAVIGTGSSGIQSLPIIASQAAELHVFQRTPAYSIPAFNRDLSDEYVADIKARYAEHRELARHSSFGVPESLPERSALEVDAEERDALFEQGWQRGELVALLQLFNDILVNPEANELVAEFVRNKIRSIVKDPKTAEALCPTSYPVGAKRACLDTDYYAMYNKDHVHLVDIQQSPIKTITASGIETSDATYDVDAIVFATGFDAMTGALVNVDIRGVGDRTLADAWSAGTQNYLGLAVKDFPNFFMITGPGSPSVMSNMMTSIEQHVEWIGDCLDYLRANDVKSIEAEMPAQNAWVEHVNEIANMTLFPQANSWYIGANVPGKPRVFMPYIGGVGPYRDKCDAVAAAGYEGFKLSADDAALKPASAG